jgi:predicted MFS family arabinose efflux permease
MRVLLWCLGMGLGIAFGAALGGSFVAERGRKVLPVVIVLTIVTGVLIGWGLNGELDAIQATNSQP